MKVNLSVDFVRCSNLIVTTFCLYLLGGCANTASEQVDDTLKQVVDQENSQDAQEAIASGVPDTDIYLFEIDAAASSLVTSFLFNATKRKGYDNQPYFLPRKNDFLFSSITDGNQSDIYLFEEQTQQLRAITQTALSEYSPTPLVNGGISSVTVESDGVQRLWRYTALGSALGTVRPDVTGIGYHTWLGENKLAVFIVAEPIALDLIETDTASRRTIATNIGRSLHRIPASKNLSYVQKYENKLSDLMVWNAITQKAQKLITMPSEVEDLTWLPDGRVLTTKGKELLMWDGKDDAWQVVFDLSPHIAGEITRLAVNDQATRLAIVASKP